MSDSIFDNETLASVRYLKYENPLSSHILQKHNISIAIVLGTGLGSFIDALKGKVSIPYNEIPYMPQPTIQGHTGHIVIGYFDSRGPTPADEETPEENRIYCLTYAGRVHSYEGISYHHVCYQVKLSAALGCKHYILTNSTGGLQNGMYDGCLFLIKDHLRLIGRSDPLFEMRYASQWKARHTNQYWDEGLQELARKSAEKLNIQLFEGTYVYASGPNYETPLEVQTAIALGGGVVGMSTVAETIAANAFGMRVLGVSMVTNLGAGISSKELTHEEVQEIAVLAIPRFVSLLEDVARGIHSISNQTVIEEPTTYESNLEKRRIDLPKFQTHLSESVEFIKKELELDGNHASTLVIATDKSIQKLMKNVKSVPLRNIPHIPVVSVSGNVGSLLYGELEGFEKPVLVIVSGNKEGFLEEESLYIASLAYQLNIKSLVHTVQGDVINENSRDEYILVEDILNVSCTTRPLALLWNVYSKPLVESIETTPLIEGSENAKRVYLSFQAPSNASQQEREMAKTFGAEILGVTNISALYAFRYLNMKVTALRTPTQENLTEYLNILKNHIDVTPLETERPALPFREKTESVSMTYVPSEKIISRDGVIQAAEYIQTHLLGNEKVKNGIIDLDINLQWPNYVVKTLPICEIPYLNTYFRSNTLRTSDVSLLKIHNQLVLAVCGCFESSAPFYLSDGSVFVRVFQELGIRKVIFTGTLVSANTSNSLSHVYSIKDHINFTGENPLIGRNEPAWGPRFPDATTAYSLKFEVPEGVTKTVVNCLFTSANRLLRLPSEKKMATALKCEVLGNLGLRELITSVHSMSNDRVLAGFLGLLEGYDRVTTSNPVQDLQDIITHFFENESKA